MVISRERPLIAAAPGVGARELVGGKVGVCMAFEVVGPCRTVVAIGLETVVFSL